MSEVYNAFAIPDNFAFRKTARGKLPVFTAATITPLIDDVYDCSYNLWSNEEYVNGEPISDYTIACIRGDIETSFLQYHSAVSLDLVATSVSVACMKHGFDPLIDRLEAAEKLWKEKGRPEKAMTMFQDYLGCEDSDFTRNVTKILTYGLIGRAYNPGMKYDTFVVFSGEQGQGKSTLFRKLGGAFFNDTMDFSMFGTEQALERLYQGIWLAEIQEMKQISKSDENTLKAFISTEVDDYRPKYARNVKKMPRRMVLVGTTNNKGDLFPDKDNRRFIVMECDPSRQTKFAWDMTEEEVELILGEMVAMYKAGIKYSELSDEIGSKQREINSSYVCRDDNLSDLETFLRMPRPADWDCRDKASKYAHYVEYLKNPDDNNPLVEQISTNEIWCEMMGNADHNMDLKTARSIARELQILGYVNGAQKTLPGYGRVRVFTLKQRPGNNPNKPDNKGQNPEKGPAKKQVADADPSSSAPKPAAEKSESVRNCPKKSDNTESDMVREPDTGVDLPWEIDDAPLTEDKENENAKSAPQHPESPKPERSVRPGPSEVNSDTQGSIDPIDDNFFLPAQEPPLEGGSSNG